MLPTSHYDKDRADRAVNFIQNLKHTKSKWAGENFELISWQEDLIRNIFGIVKENGYRQFQNTYIETSKKSGKALAISTPIPTPDGFKLMKDINLGDKIFDENGKVCSVLACTDIMYGRHCYKVNFSDGDYIIADAEHLWQINEYKPHKKPYYITKILSTYAMTKKIKNINGCYNYRIPIPGSLQLDERKLEVPPYVLGVWLADGRSNYTSITSNSKDYDMIIFKIRSQGVITRELKPNGTGSKCFGLGDGDKRQFKRNNSWQAIIRRMGLLNNKHIPQKYLRASIKQRLELLKGLMDSDGYVSKSGECEYTSIDKNLALGVLELVKTLGFKSSMKTGVAMLNGKNCGTKYRVTFFAYKNNPVFTLERKISRLKELPLKPTKNSFKTIVSIEPIGSVPVKCIQVDSKSKLYLAGKNMTPTHNSELAAAVALYLLCADGEMGGEIYSCAAERGQAAIVYSVARDMVKQSPALMKRVKIIDSQKRIIYYPTSSIYQVLSSDVATKYGYSVHGCIFDELLAQPNRKLFDVMTKGAGMAREQPLNFIITTAGSDKNSICYEVHQKAQDILNGKKIDSTFYPVLYNTPTDDDWTNPNVWKKSNPSLGVTFTLDDLKLACESAKSNPAEEMFFRQFFLCQWTSSNVRWLPLSVWDECAFTVDPDILKGRECYGGLDLSSTTDLTAFVLVFPPRTEDEKYEVLPYFWIPADNLDLRVRRDKVPYDIWKQQGFIKTTEGNVVHYGFIEAFIEDLGTIYNIREIAFDRWGAIQMSQNLDYMGFKVIPFGQGFKDMSPATKELMKLTLEKKLAHGGNPVLRWMIDNICVKTDPAGNVKPDKEKSIERIDGAVAMIMALDRAIRNMGNNGSIYDERGILLL